MSCLIDQPSLYPLNESGRDGIRPAGLILSDQLPAGFAPLPSTTAATSLAIAETTPAAAVSAASAAATTGTGTAVRFRTRFVHIERPATHILAV